jgi:Ni,Fe-hydrogenase III large subunit/Ni,Fe-hydrogenase III component G
MRVDLVASDPTLDLFRIAEQHGQTLRSSTKNHVLVQVRTAQELEVWAVWLHETGYYLVTVVANDERTLDDRAYKLYYVLSHPSDDLLVTIEYVLDPGKVTFPSIHHHFKGVAPFEHEMRDLFGLIPLGERGEHVQSGQVLYPSVYPHDLYPLRRDTTLAALKEQVRDFMGRAQESSSPVGHGDFRLPVGPIHARIIEAGQFVFTIAGEEIEKVDLHLGYTHKGIERLFQSRRSLLDGWELAQEVSADTSFAHSLAYCHSIEVLTGCEVPAPAELLRGFFLELERLYNHVGDLAALAHDVTLHLHASELEVVREHLLRLNETVAGNRFLRDLNRPGGIILSAGLDSGLIRRTIHEKVQQHAVPLARTAARQTGLRNRTVGIGRLTNERALTVGATGLVARASGMLRDFRLQHPNGIYRRPWVRALLQADVYTGFGEDELREGDIHARFIRRIVEIDSSARLIIAMLDQWEREQCQWNNETTFLIQPQFSQRANYTFALGYAEGWRGDVIYWVMQDTLGQIYRCKVRDPSMLNWQALCEAVIRHGNAVTLLPDFPVINKSFNLSYSGFAL